MSKLLISTFQLQQFPTIDYDYKMKLKELLNQKVLDLSISGSIEDKIHGCIADGLIDLSIIKQQVSISDSVKINLILNLVNYGLPTILIRQRFTSFDPKKILHDILVFNKQYFLKVTTESINVVEGEILLDEIVNGEFDIGFHLSINKTVEDIIPELYRSPGYNIDVHLSLYEKKIIGYLRDRSFESVRIRKKNGELDMVECSERVDCNKRISDILRNGSFQDIEIKQDNGKVVYINRVVKNKL